MTIWATRRIRIGGAGVLHHTVHELAIVLGRSHEVMLFSRTADDRKGEDVYLGLPDRSLLSRFPGFTEIERESLPQAMRTLVVREDGFAERFPDVAAKRLS